MSSTETNQNFLKNMEAEFKTVKTKYEEKLASTYADRDKLQEKCNEECLSYTRTDNVKTLSGKVELVQSIIDTYDQEIKIVNNDISTSESILGKLSENIGTKNQSLKNLKPNYAGCVHMINGNEYKACIQSRDKAHEKKKETIEEEIGNAEAIVTIIKNFLQTPQDNKNSFETHLLDLKQQLKKKQVLQDVMSEFDGMENEVQEGDMYNGYTETDIIGGSRQEGYHQGL